MAKYRAYDTLLPAPKDGQNGTNGTSPIILDLDNENVSIPCTYLGAIAGGLPITSNATLYKGSTKVVTGITWSLGSYSGCAIDASVISSGRLKITNVTAVSAYAEINATYGGVTYTARLTIAKVMAGAPGTSAKVYSIEPSTSAIVKKPNGTMVPNVVTCEKYVTTGASPRAATSEKYLYYTIETPNGTSQGAYPSGGLPILPDATAIIFYLYEDSTKAVLLDKERVPVISEGSNWQGKFLSRVFKRDNSTNLRKPEGGDFNSPWPTTPGWEDGIPDTPTDAMIWYSERWFTSDGASPQDSEWSEPKLLLSTSSQEFAYSSVNTPDDPPEDVPFVGNDEWSLNGVNGTLWMAERHMTNGVWSSWNVMRIKGEDGTSAKILGSFNTLYPIKADAQAAFDALAPLNKPTFGTNLVTKNEDDDSYHWTCKPTMQTVGGLRTYILKFTQADYGDGYLKKSDGHLYVADDDGWNDAGQLRGPQGPEGPQGPVGPEGPQGGNAISIEPQPASLTINVSKLNLIFVPVICNDGGVETSDFVLSKLSNDEGVEYPPNTVNEERFMWQWRRDENNNFGFYLIFSPQTSISGNLNFTVTYKNVTYLRKIVVTPVSYGARPRIHEWEKVPVGFNFTSGAPGEETYDMVTYQTQYYVCKKSHQKGTLNPSQDAQSASPEFWTWGGDGEGFIATGLILSERAVIENLVAAGIMMLNGNGDVVFHAEGGNIECHTGTFDHISINDVTANRGTYTNITAVGGTFNDIVANRGSFNDIVLSGFVRPRAVTINSTNYREFLTRIDLGSGLYETVLNGNVLRNTIILDNSLNSLIDFNIPTPDGKFRPWCSIPSRYSSSADCDDVDDYIGTIIRIINNTNSDFGFTGATTDEIRRETVNGSSLPQNQSWRSTTLRSGHEIVLRCFPSYSTRDGRQVGWEILYNNVH